MSKLLTTCDAAEYLGVTASRVRQLIVEKRLPSQKFGRDHLIREDDLKEYFSSGKNKPGRPKKNYNNACVCVSI